MNLKKLNFDKRDVFLFLTLFIIMYVPPMDPDLWWHLKYGETYFKLGHVFTDNLFSYTLPNYHWINSYWLFEVILYLLAKIGGLIAIAFSFTFISALFFTLVSKRLFKDYFVRFSGLVFISFSYTFFLINSRPHFFSTLFMVLLWLFLLFDDKFKYAKFIPFMFLLWANLHADFFVALGIFALFYFLKFAKCVFEKKKPDFVKKASLVFGISFLATLINPNFVNLYKLLLSEAFDLKSKSITIAEWMTAAYESNHGNFIYLVFFISILIVVILSIFRRKLSGFGLDQNLYDKLFQKRFELCILSGIFIVLSIKYIYFFRILTILSLPIIPFFFYEFKPLIAVAFNKSKLMVRYFWVLAGLILIAFSIAVVENIIASKDLKSVSDFAKYPYDAVTFIKKAKPKGHMFNEYNWGGYLIYTLPEYQTFIDGRMTSWVVPSENIMIDYSAIMKKKDPTFIASVFTKYDIKWALLKKDNKLAPILIEKMGGSTIYEDSTSIVVEFP